MQMHEMCTCLQVAEALQLSRSTFAKIQQNLCWAFGYNLGRDSPGCRGSPPCLRHCPHALYFRWAQALIL